MSKDVTISLRANLPNLPNFIRFGSGEAAGACDVAELTDDELQAIGEAWTRALIEHAQKRRSK